MREKTKAGKFRRERKRASVVIKKDDMKWLSKHTHFDPENIELWHKVLSINNQQSDLQGALK